MSDQANKLISDVENLIVLSESSNYDAQQRLKAIIKLSNLIYDFSHSDYSQILKKPLPNPVKKGIKLYKLMNELTYLVQPIGKTQGSACRVCLIDYENLTYEKFLDLRGDFNSAFTSKGYNQKDNKTFNGLAILDDKQKELYERIKIYFGGRKKPTLQSLAMNLLNEETDGKDYSERSLYSYIKSINNYFEKRRKMSGFDIFSFAYFSVIYFNRLKSIREINEELRKTKDKFRNLNTQLLDTFSEFNKKISHNFFESVIQKIQIPTFENQIKELNQIFASKFKELSNKKTK